MKNNIVNDICNSIVFGESMGLYNHDSYKLCNNFFIEYVNCIKKKDIECSYLLEKYNKCKKITTK